jgi:TonB family protein
METAMSNMPVFVDNSVPPENRRGQARQPLSALAYLDIGTDNGGIVLNVSEDGLALQAVGPLDEKSDVNLRIQLPHSDKRIESVAKVVWLSASNRQAGLRFLSMSAEGRSQISKWIESQNAPGSADEETPVVGGKNASGTAVRQAPSLDSQREKWLSLMKEFEAQTAQQQASSVSALQMTAETHEAPASAAPSAALVRPRPEIVSRRFGERVKQDPPITPQTEPPAKWGPYTPKPGAAAKSNAGEAVDQLVPAAIASREAQVATSTIPGSAIVLPELISPAPAGGVDADATRNIMRRSAEAASRTRALGQIAVVALFALFALLCFGIGTWVGRVANRHSQLQTKENSSSATTVAQRVPGPMVVDTTAASPKSAEIERKRPERAPARLVAENRVHKAAASAEHAASTQSQQPVGRSVAPAPREENPPPSSATPSASSSSPNMETAPVNYVTEAPSPRIVDGHVLRPSDRFNPCHLTYQVEPRYPLEAQQQGIQGTVKIHLVIATDGSVSSEQLISGPPQLASAALEATKYWRYFPALLNGQPVQTQKDVEVPFRLTR